jgi:uncharacterized FlaG/YvyC family protein
MYTLATQTKKENWTRRHYQQQFLEQLHKNSVNFRGGTAIDMPDGSKKLVVTTGDAQTDDLIRTFVGPLGVPAEYNLVKGRGR